MTGTPFLTLDFDLRKNVNYVTYQAESLTKEWVGSQSNSFSFLRTITIENTSDSDLRDVTLSFEASPEEALSIAPIHISLLERHKKTVIASFEIRLDPTFLYSLSERRLGTLKAVVKDEAGETLLEKSAELAFFPIEESASEDRIDELLASFVTPNDPAVLKVLQRAHEIKAEKYGDGAFVGYMLHDPNKLMEEIESVYLAAQELQIDYSLPPASFEKSFQRVRLPSHVIQEKLATCIDFAILLASVLEAAGLNPILVLFKNHCYAGVWLEDLSFLTPKEENGQTVLNYASKGYNRLLLIEATYLRKDETPRSLLEASEAAYQTLESSKNFQYAIDVTAARKERLLPIPSLVEGKDGKVHVDFPSIRKEETVLPSVDLSSRRFLEEGYAGKKGRFDHWEDKLLDLNLRNRLISYKTGNSGVEFLSTDAEKAMSFLEGHSKVSLVPTPIGISVEGNSPAYLPFPPLLYADEVMLGYSRDSLLAVNRTDSVELSLKGLSRRGNTALEESGCNPLFLTLGLIRHFDNPKAAENGTGALYAPIFLLPVRLPRRKSGPHYTLEYSIDDLQLNRTAFEYFKENFGLSFDRLIPLPRKENGAVDLRLIYNEIRSIIQPMRNWALLENTMALSLYNFAHFVMWNDLVMHRKDMLAHPTILSFVSGERKWEDDENLKDPVEMDSAIEPSDIAAPLPADSSQIKAIYDAERGESFILDGPPGTGKSQTIANMIVNFLYHGKKVLFVAEKEVALDVVKRRLDELSLGQFALKLANLATPKSDILSNYNNLLELGPLEEAPDYKDLAKDLGEKRKELNGLLSSIHDRGAYFLSPYEAILGYLGHQEGATMIDIPSEYIEGLSNLDYREAVKTIEETARLGSLFGSYARSPFRGFTNEEYSFGSRSQIEGRLNEAKALSEKLRLAVYNAFRKFAIKRESRNNVEAFLTLIDIFQRDERPDPTKFEDAFFLSKEEELQKGASLLADMAKKKEEADLVWDERAYLLDASALLSEGTAIQKLSFFKKHGASKEFWKRLKPYRASNKRVKHDALLGDLKSLAAYQSDKAAFEGMDPYVKKTLGEWLTMSVQDVEKASLSLAATLSIAKAFRKLDCGEERKDVLSAFKEAGDGLLFSEANETLKKLFEDFKGIEGKLEEDFKIDLSLYGDSADYFRYLSEKITDALSSLGRMGEWTHFLLSFHEMEKRTPKSFVDAFKNAKITEKNLADSFVSSVCFHYLGIVLSERGIANLTAESTRSAIDFYAKAIKDYQSLSIAETAARISSKFPAGASHFAASTSAYQLSKLAKNGGRGVSLRTIFHLYRDLIQTLTPCFMTSPATLAQYLAPEDYHFDVVIFDEASQIPTSEAVGALYRADSFVIAGDQEQMPPSQFFVSVLGKEEDAPLASLDEDLESLLDDALVLHLPRKRLNWHYRSNHESLIAFSNNRFYGNSLLTFPSPEEESESVEFRKVKGSYEKGRGVNRPEAKAMVAEILKRLKNPATRRFSIGVVTFNEAQQNLVEDLLEKELLANPKLDSAPGGEKIFVKNLENVQGDERDVILFGVTYGPDKDGRLSLNFGPLSLRKGERRLNVAVSRAREKMIVFASFDPEAIQAERAKNEGASYLRDFLLFAKFGSSALPNRLGNLIDPEPESVVPYLAEDLRKLGFVVETNLGTSTLKIDLAIASKEDPKSFVLGILLDNPKYAAMSCRDRHVNEPTMLHRLSWNLLSLYSVEYLDHKEEVLKAIVSAYNAASLPKEEEEAEEPSKGGVEKPELRRKPILPPQNLRPYTAYERTDGDDDVETFIYHLVQHEFPIGNSLLDARVRGILECGRITAGERNKINEAIRNLQLSVEYCGRYTFYYPKNYDPLTYRFWRKSGESGAERRIIDYSYYEIGNCAADILLEQGAMSIGDLAKAVSKAIGYDALPKSYADYLKYALRANASKRNGIYVDEDGNVSLR